MDDLFKKEIVALIELEKDRLGSYNKVATKTGASSATISQMRANNWELIKDEMWQQVASKLGYQPKNWNVVPITNYKVMTTTMRDAKNEQLFFAVSHSAGSGKTASINDFAEKSNSTYVIQAREWSRREFLVKLTETLGIEAGRGYISVDKLIDKVIKFFRERASFSPLLIVDEADKLKPSALRFFIPFYNALEDLCGVVIAGTENLEKEVKAGVRYNKKGFDELDSRFGRNFIHLIGATEKDINAICAANGITDSATQKEIFKEASPSVLVYGGKQYKVVSDLRRVKRIIKRKRIELKG